MKILKYHHKILNCCSYASYKWNNFNILIVFRYLYMLSLLIQPDFLNYIITL